MLLVGFGALHCGSAIAQPKPAKPLPPLVVGKDGKLTYNGDAKGNRVPDFSYSGYMAGETALPEVPVKVTVPVKAGDATWRIQSAIDYVSALVPDKAGFRGAVLLEKGTYTVEGALKIAASGVILRGSGAGSNGTLLLGAGTDRQTLITVSGKFDRKTQAPVKVTDPYVPVNATKLTVPDASPFKAGDQVLVQRPSTKAWIDLLGTDHFGGGITSLGWKPGQRDVAWDRKIISISGNTLTLDAPLTTALDTAFGGGTVSKYSWPGRIERSGIENMRLVSAYDEANPKDEAHRWMAIVIANTTDAWVRRVNFSNFAGSAVMVQETGKRITIEDCKSLNPVSEIGGERRNTFFTAGQQTLFQRIYAEFGFHDFGLGFCAAGPNAFVQCESHLPYSFSGPIDSWASGVLFDIVNVDGQALSYLNRGQDGQGAGWNAANSVFWQCSASRIDCYQPPGANNWSYASWAQFAGDGYWESSNEQVQPRSLYYAQLKERVGESVKPRMRLLDIQTEASSSPPVDVAMALTKEATNAAPLLADLIDRAGDLDPLPVNPAGIKTIDDIGVKTPVVPALAAPLKIANGVLVRGGIVVTGKQRDVPWWNGSARPYALAAAKQHITRFVPGKTGNGLTDDPATVSDSMVSNNVVALDHNYGLWYERRRDDHERIRRMDGDVWAPFYELPFARSGQGTAWDGMSRYDLTKYNKWYWSRLKQFADLADQKGLVLIHENYFQHNIIEAGAHYADFPWRPVNNINNTGFPEPVNYAGDKRLFMAGQFYDVTNPARRNIHKAYIRQCLNNFTGNSGVIQLIGAEFTGPLHFVQFWLDNIGDWEKETGKKELVGLSTTKDVQDAILADPERAKLVDIIDIRYWHYQADGKAYAPPGGQNLAPRQHARLLKPKASSFEQVYRAVAEYRQKYPTKAVMYSGDGAENNGWAVFMAGGSLAAIPKTPDGFLKEASAMKPLALPEKITGQYALSGGKSGYIIYNGSAQPVKLDLSRVPGTLTLQWINTRNGALSNKNEKIKGGSVAELTPPGQDFIAWITQK
ncbi:pectate lyase [Pedobacter sp. HMF7056]|uniref:Pectate lyase n=1 Tax=Hufsiella ginkgonis TaxID=2695274 RepID=A0A7K1XWQ5_9SPHI|nr:pectate lyase [Hufsiella ginkgonis]